MDRVIRLLAVELTDLNCLEIGVGTGRFALPLARSGVTMTGIDLSELMLRSLVDKSEGAHVSLSVADATRLPFRDAVFDAGLACHVFHLIEDWPAALSELFRVVGSGRIAHDFGHFGRGQWLEVLQRFLREAGLPARHIGANSAEEVDAAARDLGAAVRLLEPIADVRRSTLNKSIDGLERGTFSITWGADDATRKAAADRVREWAAERFGDLDAQRDIPFDVSWRVYEF